MRIAMPLLLRITVCSLCLVVVGVIFAFGAPAADSWQSLRYFAVGSLIVGLSLIASLLTSTLSALLHPQWRRAALWLAALSCLLLVSGFLIWLNA